MRSRTGALATAVVVALLAAPAAAHADPSPSATPPPSPSPAPAHDIAALGASVAGQVRSTVQITVGVHNLGPSSTEPPEVIGPILKRFFAVELPAGAELVEQSSTLCGSPNFDPPDPRHFGCVFLRLEPGEHRTVTFHARVMGPITSKGTVSTHSFGLGTDLDTNVANNTAPITITTGQLPETGTDSKTIAVIGTGAVLLGGLMLLVVRRFGRRRE